MWLILYGIHHFRAEFTYAPIWTWKKKWYINFRFRPLDNNNYGIKPICYIRLLCVTIQYEYRKLLRKPHAKKRELQPYNRWVNNNEWNDIRLTYLPSCRLGTLLSPW